MEWGKFRLDDLFEINKTLSFNTEDLTTGGEYDYITRTSQNQGILQETGFVNEENINSAGNWSLGLLQMDFFYRSKPWYAGQFVRKVIPKIKLNNNLIKFFTVSLNKLKPKLLTLAVRHVEETFLNSEISLPTKNGKIDFDFMENFIEELEKEKIEKLNNYLEVTGLKDYNLTSEEEKVLEDFENGEFEWDKFKLFDLFESSNGNFDIKKEHINNKGNFVITAGLTDRGILGKTDIDAKIFDEKTITVDMFGFTFYRNFKYKMVTHARAFSLKPKFEITDNQGLFLSNSFHFLNNYFGYEKMCTWQKVKNINIQLPIKNNELDYELMETLISAVQKIVIKDVVNYTDGKMS